MGIGRLVLSQTPAMCRTDLTSVSAILPRHILLVEDDAAIRAVVAEVLEDEGYVVTANKTPVEAMQLLDQGSFDLVITDGFSTLPRDTLITTADLVRSAGLTPVALFSAHAHDPDVARAAGFCDLITKPFDLDTLVHQVKAVETPNAELLDDAVGVASATSRGGRGCITAAIASSELKAIKSERRSMVPLSMDALPHAYQLKPCSARLVSMFLR